MPLFSSSLIVDLVTFAATLIVIVYAYFKWCYRYWKWRNVPFLEPAIPFGNLPNPLTNNLSFGDNTLKMYNEAKARGWKYCGIYTLMLPAFMPLDLELLKRVMTKDFNHFVDRGSYHNEKDDPVGANVFTLGGTKWRHLRTKLSPTFTSGKIKMMFQTIVDFGLVLEKYIEKNIAGKEAADIKEVLACFSTDTIGACAFGLDCNSFEEPNSPFRRYGRKILPTNALETIKFNFITALPNVARALRMRQFKKEVSDFFTRVVEDAVLFREKNNVTRNDFLQLLMDMRSQDRNGTGDGNTLTMSEVVAQSFAFFFGGFETSSTLMTFVLFELARRPEIQDKVREEIRAVLAQHDGEVTYESLNEFVYMKQVIDETFRMYPPIPFLTRECIEDYKIPGEDVVIEKGTPIIIPVAGLHYDEEYYENPMIFNPDRFSVENKKNMYQYAHIPFGEGPRICIGERFGMLQTKVGLVSVLKNFKVSLNGKTKVPLKMDPQSAVTAADGGIWLNIEKV